MYGAMTPFWAVAAKKVRATLKARQAPMIAMAAVFSFVIMMFNVPAPGGTTGHATGAAIAAIVLGPWAASLAVSTALVVQAILFGDGGITAIGANCFTMAVIMPFTAWIFYKSLCGSENSSVRRKTIAAGIAGYISLNAAAFATSILFGIQPLIASRPDGTPLYSPYPLKVAIPAMMVEHLFIFGFVEAVVTALIVGYLYKAEPAIFTSEVTRPMRKSVSAILWAAVAVITILTPIGMIAPGTAWGEWSAEEIGKRIGFIPQGFSKLQNVWNALLPDYSIPALSGKYGAVGAYIISGIVGIIVSGLIVFAIAKLITARKPSKQELESS